MATKRKTPTKAQKAQRKAKFQQSTVQNKNMISKMQNAYHTQMQQRQEIIRRATIVDAIYEARPELSIEIDGKLVLNMDNVYLNTNDNLLYWKADNNPIISGLDSFDKYPLYSIELFNEVLEFIQNHKKQASLQSETNIDLGDFDLVEDDNYTDTDVSDGVIEIDSIVVDTAISNPIEGSTVVDTTDGKTKTLFDGDWKDVRSFDI